jgi:hypothetical protein
MALSVSVIIPYRDEGGHFKRIAEWTEARWRAIYPEWEIVVADCPADEDFRRGKARNIGAARATGRALLFVDADCVPERIWANFGVDALADHEVCVPFRSRHRLTAEESETILRAGPEDDLLCAPIAPDDRRDNGIPCGGFLMAIRRDAFALCGGYDPRITGWGHEDDIFARVVETLLTTRKQGFYSALHLWHPPCAMGTLVNRANNGRYYNQYRAASGRPQQMLEVIKQWQTQ